MKIRVVGSPIYSDMFSAMGANPTQMSWADAQPALSSGAVDGQENPLFLFTVLKMHTVGQKFVTTWGYVADPLISRPISVTMLLGLYEAADRVVADAQAIQVPTQLLISGADFVVKRQPQEQFFERLGSVHKEKHVLPGFFHDTLGERDRAPAIAAIRRFVSERFAQPLVRPSLRDAHRHGPTFDEAEMIPAAGQGALGIEVRADRQDLIDALKPLAHAPSWMRVAAERTVSRALGGSCSMPLAAHAEWMADGALRLQAAWGDPDGRIDW